MAERTLDILIRAQDEATRTLQNVGRAGVQAGEQLEQGLGGAFTTVAETGSTAAKDVQFAWEQVSIGGALGAEADAAFAPATAAGVESANEVEAAWRAAGVATIASVEETATAVTVASEKEATAQVAASEKASGAFAGLKGSALGAAGAIGIGALGAKMALDAYDELEKSTKRLEIGFAAIHQPQSLDELTAWASDFADRTGILQADVEDFSGKLLNMGSGFFTQAGPAGLKLLENITTALEGMSAETGKSAQMLMRSLGPAILNTPEKAIPLLQKYGSLTEAQATSIKKLTDAGKDEAATQEIINDLTGKYGDAAARSATAQDKMKEQWNKIEVTLGEVVSKILPPLVSLLQTVSPVLKVAADHAALLLSVFLGYKALGFVQGMLTGIGAAAKGLALTEAATGAERFGASIGGIPGKAGGAVASLKSLATQAGLLAAAFFTVNEAEKVWNAQQDTNRANASARHQEYSEFANDLGLTAIQTGNLTDEQIKMLQQLEALKGTALDSKGGLAILAEAQDTLDRRVKEGRISWDTYAKIVGETGLQLDVAKGEAGAAATAVQGTADATQHAADASEAQAIALAKVQPLLKSTTQFFGHQITSLADLKSSWNDWKTQTAGALDFVGGSFDTLAQKEGESVSQLKAGLDKSLASMKVFGANLHTIAQDGGKGAQELVQHLLALGPAGATMAQKLVDAGREGRRGIEGDLGGALKVAQTEAQHLEKALVGGFHQIARAIIIATTPVDKLAAKLAALDGKQYQVDFTVTTHYEQIGSPSPGTPAGIHAPQIAAAMGYHGMVSEPTWIHVAEGGKAERVDIGPAASGSASAGGGNLAVAVNIDRRRFLDRQDYELRFGGPA